MGKGHFACFNYPNRYDIHQTIFRCLQSQTNREGVKNMNYSASPNRQNQWVRSALVPGLWFHPTGYWYFDKSQLMAYYDDIAHQWLMYDYNRNQRHEYSADVFYCQNPVLSQKELVAPVIPERQKIQTAEFMLHNDQTKTMFSGTLNFKESVIEGLLSSYDKKELFPVTIHYSYPDLFEIHPKPISKDTWGLVDSSGNWTDYRIEGYSVTESNGGAVQLHKGIFIGPDGNKVRFEVTTLGRNSRQLRAVPPSVIIVGIAAGFCLLALGVQKWAQDCKEEKKEAIKACTESGGLPTVTGGVVNFGVTFEPKFTVGCHLQECQFKCEPKPIA